MKKLTSLLMLAALTSGALALTSTDSFAKAKAARPISHKTVMQKHSKTSKKTGKVRKGRKGSRKAKSPQVIAPAQTR